MHNIGYFNLFFTTSLLPLFPTETNKHARNFFDKYVTEQQIPKNFRNFEKITIDEMKIRIRCANHLIMLDKDKQSANSLIQSNDDKKVISNIDEILSYRR
jgi:hypothetical protein